MKKWYVASLAGILMCGLSLPVWAQDEGDGDFPEDDFYLSDFAASAIGDKCECPESESGLDAYERCLKKNKDKASGAFKKAVRFTGESMSDFKSSLNDAVDELLLTCEDSFSGDDGGDDTGDPGDDFNDDPPFP